MCSIAQRGVLLVGTVHGADLRALLSNPELNPLIGGVQSVTLGDAAARWVGYRALPPLCARALHRQSKNILSDRRASCAVRCRPGGWNIMHCRRWGMRLARALHEQWISEHVGQKSQLCSLGCWVTQQPG